MDLSSSQVFFRLVRMLRPWWGWIALGLVMLFISAPCELFPGLVWKFVTDDIVLQRHSSPFMQSWFSLGGQITDRYHLLLASAVWLFVVYAIGETLGTLVTWLLSRIAQQFIFKLRNRVYHKLQSQSLSYLQRQRTGDLMSRAMSDVEELQQFIISGIDVIIGDGLLWLTAVFLVMWMDWRVATASLSPLLIVYFLLRFFNKRVQPIYAAARARLGDVSTRLQENLAGVVVIKIFGREKQEAQRFADATQAHYNQQLKAITARSLYFPFTRAVGFLSNVSMIGVGGYFMLKDGSFSPGELVAFRAYWYRLFGPIQSLARVNDMVQRSIAAARRVFEVLDSPDELPDAPDAQPVASIRGEMEFRAVSFAYPNPDPGTRNPPPVLHDVTLAVHPGQTVAICGPSGSGKSTILNLLLRFYDPVAGQVLLDGRDLRSIRRDSLRRHFALVQQETFLFNDSILDNIRYGHSDATMDQVIAAAQAANAHSFITQLPSGYDTKVGERGVRLSGGQKQRISIARAFLANPTILLLDEPTSSVEPDSEAAIIAALDRLMTGRTTVLTSHRPSLINQAAIVYVIEDGRVTSHGPPAQVAKLNPWFSRFLRSPEELPSPTLLARDPSTP